MSEPASRPFLHLDVFCIEVVAVIRWLCETPRFLLCVGFIATALMPAVLTSIDSVQKPSEN
jgi:hypothetical protein